MMAGRPEASVPFSYQKHRRMHVLLSYIDEGDQALVRVAIEGEVEN